MERVCDGLKVCGLEVGPQDLWVEILEFLECADLLRLGQTNVAFAILANELPLWMTLCIRKFRLEFAFPSGRWNWKELCLRLAGFVYKGRYRMDFHGQVVFQKPFQSVFLSNRWFRCNMRLDQFYPVEQLVDRLNRENVDQSFAWKYELAKKPALIRGVTDDWRCVRDSNLWSLDNLARRFPDVKWKISHAIQSLDKKLEMRMADYINYLRHQMDETPLYIFDSKFGEKAPEMLSEYDLGSFKPFLFQEDFFHVLDDERKKNSNEDKKSKSHHRPYFRWVVAGPARTGAPWHLDPTSTSAWNALISGHKRWALYPPGQIPPGVEPIFSDPEGKHLLDVESPSSLRWYLEVYPNLAPEERPLEIIQGPGDVVFIPSNWWHMVLNLDDTISVTQNFVGKSNLRAAVQELYHEQGIPGVLDFIHRLERKHPELGPKLEILQHIFEHDFSSELDYVKSFRDVNKWQSKLTRIMKHHGIQTTTTQQPAYTALTKRFNPTFLHHESNLIIKLYSHYPNVDTGFFGDSIESPFDVDGGHIKCVESLMLREIQRQEQLVPVPAPTLVHEGVFYGQGSGKPWHWPYIIMEKMEGQTLADYRDKNEWRSSAGRWVLKRSLHSLASWLGVTVRNIHSLNNDNQLHQRLSNNNGFGSFPSFLRVQVDYALSSHWRKGLISQKLLREMEAFVKTYLPYILEKSPNAYVPLHGDLQQENILVVDPKDNEKMQTIEFLKTIFPENDDAHDHIIEMLVNHHQLRLSSLRCMTERDLSQLGLSLGPKILLRNALPMLLERNKETPTTTTRLVPVGIIDFGDAIFGDPLQELVAIHISAFRCDKKLLETFLTSYHRAHDGNYLFGYDRRIFPFVAMTLTIIHRCEALAMVFKYRPELLDNDQLSWEQLAEELFSI